MFIGRKEYLAKKWFGKGDYEMAFVPIDLNGNPILDDGTRFEEDSILKNEPFREHPYAPLMGVLMRAHDQASNGKGKERHSNGKDFMNQPIITDGRNLPDGLIFQARKKLLEASKCADTERAVTDLLGAIVYTAAYVIIREESQCFGEKRK